MNILGCDLNFKLKSKQCKLLLESGYKFVFRYVGRTQMASYDLDLNEAKTILDSGLDLGIVQHCPIPPWDVSLEKGKLWGTNAALFSKQCGYDKGCCVFLDLEGLRPGTPKQTIFDFCNAWYDEVYKEGFQPGIYLGYDIFISSVDAFNKLKFQTYWAAYNVDIVPIHREYSIRQRLETNIGGMTIDPDHMDVDKLGNKPIFMSKTIVRPNPTHVVTIEELKTKCLSNPELWDKVIDAAKDGSNLGDLEVVKYFDQALIKVYNFGKTNTISNVEELKNKTFDSPELWNKAIDIAQESFNIGDFEVMKYFNEALMKVYNYSKIV